LIGLDESDRLSASGAGVARKQCTIDNVGEKFEIADPGSHNGTFVNGIPVRHRVIEHGDTIRVRESELLFLVYDDEKAGASELRLSEESSDDQIKTIRVERATVFPTFADHVGHMARDLAALFRISNIINSIRDLELAAPPCKSTYWSSPTSRRAFRATVR
jgi:pSer/pThr/pTyr-binding forkhead associated (FHA) protein